MAKNLIAKQAEDNIRIIDRHLGYDGCYLGAEIIEVTADEADKLADALHQLAGRIRRMQAERFGPPEYTIRDVPKPEPKPTVGWLRAWWRRVRA